MEARRAPVAVAEDPLPVDPTLLEPFDALIRVSIEGRPFDVPANNSLLRVLQYLDFDLYPCRLCWNGDCDNCRFSYLEPDTGEPHSEKGCQLVVCDGLTITKLPPDAVWPPEP